MGHLRSTVIAISILLLSVACSQVNPDISAIEQLPPLIVNPNTTNFTTKNMAAFDVTILGSVSRFASRLQISIDNGASWQPLDQTRAQNLVINQSACAELCPFSFSIIDLGTKWPSLAALPINGEATLLLRGIGQFGNTGVGSFTVKRVKGGFISIGAITGMPGLKANKTIGNRFKVIGSKLQANAGKNLSNTTINAKGAQQ